MIVDDHHALAAILATEFWPLSGTPPIYLDAQVPATMHLRLVWGLSKPGIGQLTRILHTAQPDPTRRLLAIDRIAAPRAGLTVLDDRPRAGAIGGLAGEPGVSLVFAALIAHAQATGQPILIAPENDARWKEIAERRGIVVVVQPTHVAGR